MPGSAVHFTWHGGEPTLLGLGYFKKIMALQKKHKPEGYAITNNMQTNGVLVDKEWCRFLAGEGFTVGLSLDGTEELHDTYRHTAAGEATHKEALRGFRLLQQCGVPCDILCVVNAVNAEQPMEVYRFFKEIGAGYLSFIPLVEPDARGGVSERSVSAEAWGGFLCAVFDEWLRRDIGKVQVQIIEEVARTALGHEQSLCIFKETCGNVPVVEHNGDFYSCDHFVDKEHRLGNIARTPLSVLLDHPDQAAFGDAKAKALPGYCRKCEVLSMCHGGCPKDRIIKTQDGEAGLNFLCAGYRRFFNHTGSFAQQLAIQSRGASQYQRPAPGGAPSTQPATTQGAPDELPSTQPATTQGPPDELPSTRPAPKQPPQTQPPQTQPPRQKPYSRSQPKVGRNDPCPCGSGRKYKNCCLRK